VRAESAPLGAQRQRYLASGKRVSMRLWRDKAPGAAKPAARRDYETVGYILDGHAELRLEGQMIRLEPGDCWLVPANAEHSYRILEPFTAIEATAPPAQVHGRDQS
jgi:quercetin dioxygenase-like cupin family protein